MLEGFLEGLRRLLKDFPQVLEDLFPLPTLLLGTKTQIALGIAPRDQDSIGRQTLIGKKIAVKKLKTITSKAEIEFAVEVEILERVRHKNMLTLQGYCVGVNPRLIVYDYMPNLSLLSHLRGQFASEMQLDWKKRMNVIIGSAQGLVKFCNLHETVELPVDIVFYNCGGAIIKKIMNG
ncbi:PTI1-like tyrosine-protein kinase [Platanthera zijinensis]|uniref:non-specific serine/threonine protein kinase n=1 Tax=Platanthera zijinensis TaxID=2320716 RepID=A0AAP0BU47_9ASPA